MSVCAHTYHSTELKARKLARVSSLFPLCVASGDWSQVIRIRSKCLYPQSHLAGQPHSFFKVATLNLFLKKNNSQDYEARLGKVPQRNQDDLESLGRMMKASVSHVVMKGEACTEKPGCTGKSTQHVEDRQRRPGVDYGRPLEYYDQIYSGKISQMLEWKAGGEETRIWRLVRTGRAGDHKHLHQH